MTPDKAIAIVKSKASGRTRWEGQEPFLDEVLVMEIERLRSFISDHARGHSLHMDGTSAWMMHGNVGRGTDVFDAMQPNNNTGE